MASTSRKIDEDGGPAPHGEGPVIVWFRSDLRVADNLALSEAVGRGGAVVALFVMDETRDAPRRLGGARRWWLHHSLQALAGSLEERDIQLVLRTGGSREEVLALAGEVGAAALYWNRRYDPAGVAADKQIMSDAKKKGLEVRSFPGQLLHEPQETLTGGGGPYRVYTPFWRALQAGDEPRAPVDAPGKAKRRAPPAASENLADWKLRPAKPDWSGGIAESWEPGEEGAAKRLESFISGAFDRYASGRDLPGEEGTSRLSPHLAFGEITPYQIWAQTSRRPAEISGDDRTSYRKEVVWREFAYHLLFHNPDLASRNYNGDFDAMPWLSDDEAFGAWTKGETGYPIVDAGMRQLWQTGWMHNRVRMITASFLTKYLLIDWRRGEEWFWDTLVDADPASNAAQWQWVAGSGADAAPYFRIFNPMLQGTKVDPDGAYVRRFVPELAELPGTHIHAPWEAPDDMLEKAGVKLGDTYPRPIVDHQAARRRALDAYQKVKKAA